MGSIDAYRHCIYDLLLGLMQNGPLTMENDNPVLYHHRRYTANMSPESTLRLCSVAIGDTVLHDAVIYRHGRYYSTQAGCSNTLAHSFREGCSTVPRRHRRYSAAQRDILKLQHRVVFPQAIL